MKPDYPKLVFAVLMSIYFLWIAYDPMAGSFLDIVDLPIHEAGHIFFSPFGQFVTVAGGSLFQLIVPAVFVGYFWWNEKYYSAAIVLFWFGQSLINVFTYVQDAIVMQLVLLGGLTGSEGSFHDWNYLLTETNLLSSTNQIAGLIRFLGILCVITATVFSIRFSFSKE